MKKSRKLEFKSTELVVLILAICVFSTLTGCLVGYKALMPTCDNKNEETYHDYTELDADLKNFIDEYNEIKENYYGVFDSKKALTNALNALLASLGDDYSGMMDMDSSNSEVIRLQGIYTGVGIEIYNDEKGNLIVNRVFENSPAYNSGIKAGDQITKFNNISVQGLSSSEIASKIKNAGSSVFTLEILREGARFNISLKSASIEVKSVYSDILNNGNKKIGYIKLDIFANNSGNQFKEAFKKINKSNVEGIILDFRDNPGGYLHTAVDIANLFLDGSNLIYKTKNNTIVEGFHATGAKDYDKKIVILINNNSASGSELLTLTLKENLGATIVGTTSYGKGTVQELKKFNGADYKYTTKLWLSPNGVSINGIGIVPDVIVANTSSNDYQLEKALEQFR